MPAKKPTPKPTVTKPAPAAPPVKAMPDNWAKEPYMGPEARAQKAQSFIGSMDRKQQKQGLFGAPYEGMAPLTAQQRADKMADLTKRLNRGELTPQEFSQGANVVRRRRSASGVNAAPVSPPYDKGAGPRKAK